MAKGTVAVKSNRVQINKHTSQGFRNIKTSSMNKHTRRSFKKYKGQGS